MAEHLVQVRLKVVAAGEQWLLAVVEEVEEAAAGEVVAVKGVN